MKRSTLTMNIIDKSIPDSKIRVRTDPACEKVEDLNYRTNSTKHLPMQRIHSSVTHARVSELAKPCGQSVSRVCTGAVRPKRLASITGLRRSTIVYVRTDDDEAEVEAQAKTAVSSTVTLRPWKMNLPTEIGLAVFFPSLSLLGAAAYSQVRFELDPPYRSVD